MVAVYCDGSPLEYAKYIKIQHNTRCILMYFWCYRSAVGDMSTTCQYRGCVSFSPVNLVSRTCQYGPFREHQFCVFQWAPITILPPLWGCWGYCFDNNTTYRTISPSSPPHPLIAMKETRVSNFTILSIKESLPSFFLKMCVHREVHSSFFKFPFYFSV